jgi:Icc-related predicted phosphoesterase
MRILALADIHNAHQKVENILAAQENVDLILLVGDITTNGTEEAATNIIDKIKKYGKPIFGIAGNMDSLQINSAMIKMDCSIDGREKHLNDVGFFGVSGGPYSMLHTPFEISEDEILQKAENGWLLVKDFRWKIFVPHAPPFQTKLDKPFLGKHVGSTAVRQFIERHQPDAVLCGHIHESRGTDILGRTKMMNCGSTAQGYYGIVTIGNDITLENCG